MATPYTNPFHDSETTLRSILSNPLKSTSSRTLDIYIYIHTPRHTVEAHSGYTPFRQKGSSVKFKKRKKEKKEKEEKRWRETHERTR